MANLKCPDCKGEYFESVHVQKVALSEPGGGYQEILDHGMTPRVPEAVPSGLPSAFVLLRCARGCRVVHGPVWWTI